MADDAKKSIQVTFKIMNKNFGAITKLAQAFGVAEKEAIKMQKGFNTAFKDLKKEFKSTQQAVKGFITPIAAASTAATASFVACINKTREYADRVDDFGKKMGLSKKGFQEWDYIIKQNGGNIESLQMGMKTLVNQTAGVLTGNKNAIKNFNQLGISIKGSNGQLKNQETLFKEVTAKLQKMPDGIKKAKLVNDMFGRSGSEFMPLFKESAQSIESLYKEMDKLGIIMTDDQIDAANTCSDNIYALQRGFGALGQQVGNIFIPKLNQFMQIVINKMPQIRAKVIPTIEQISQNAISVFKRIGNTLLWCIEHIEEITRAIKIFGVTFLAIKGIQAATATIKTVSYSWQLMSQFVNLCTQAYKANVLWSGLATVGTKALGVALRNLGFIAIITAAITAIAALEKRFHLLEKTAKATWKTLKKGKDFFTNKNKDEKAVSTATSIPKHATGTTFAPGGLSLVGENGPELVNLRRGATVTNNKETQKIIGSKDITININVPGNMIGNGEFINQIKQVLGKELKTALAV